MQFAVYALYAITARLVVRYFYLLRKYRKEYVNMPNHAKAIWAAFAMLHIMRLVLIIKNILGPYVEPSMALWFWKMYDFIIAQISVLFLYLCNNEIAHGRIAK